MIFHPRTGQRVCIHYARRSASIMPNHGRVGVVQIVSKGPGPRNVCVDIGAMSVVVPRGNLVGIGNGGANSPKSTPDAEAPGVEKGGVA